MKSEPPAAACSGARGGVVGDVVEQRVGGEAQGAEHEDERQQLQLAAGHEDVEQQGERGAQQDGAAGHARVRCGAEGRAARPGVRGGHGEGVGEAGPGGGEDAGDADGDQVAGGQAGVGRKVDQVVQAAGLDAPVAGVGDKDGAEDGQAEDDEQARAEVPQKEDWEVAHLVVFDAARSAYAKGDHDDHRAADGIEAAGPELVAQHGDGVLQPHALRPAPAEAAEGGGTVRGQWDGLEGRGAEDQEAESCVRLWTLPCVRPQGMRCTLGKVCCQILTQRCML